MSGRFDVIVLGAGPAGTAAAIEAASQDLAVLLLDEAPEAGGQVHRAPSPALAGPRDPEWRAGDALRAALAASSVTCRFGQRVWLLERGYGVTALGPEGTERHEAPALILAAGATERLLPTPGWTLPGVIGLAAAGFGLTAFVVSLWAVVVVTYGKSTTPENTNLDRLIPMASPSCSSSSSSSSSGGPE